MSVNCCREIPISTPDRFADILPRVFFAFLSLSWRILVEHVQIRHCRFLPKSYIHTHTHTFHSHGSVPVSFNSKVKTTLLSNPKHGHLDHPLYRKNCLQNLYTHTDMEVSGLLNALYNLICKVKLSHTP
jgi:hypothetical protein